MRTKVIQTRVVDGVIYSFWLILRHPRFLLFLSSMAPIAPRLNSSALCKADAAACKLLRSKQERRSRPAPVTIVVGVRRTANHALTADETRATKQTSQ
jgi:hypothetical protein